MKSERRANGRAGERGTKGERKKGRERRKKMLEEKWKEWKTGIKNEVRKEGTWVRGGRWNEEGRTGVKEERNEVSKERNKA